MKEASALYRLLGDEARLRLLRVLDKDRFNVKELTGILGLAQSGVSRHLGLLKESELVVEERDGAYSFYRLSPAVKDGRGRSGRCCSRNSTRPSIRRCVKADESRLQEVLRLRRENFEHVGPDTRDGRQLVPGRSWAAWSRALGLLLPPLEVADLGCGEGYLTVETARWAKHVTAVDRSAGVLARAKALAERKKLKNITWKKGELEKLPIETATMDVALLSQALHHASEPSKALRRSVAHSQARRPPVDPRSAAARRDLGPREARRSLVWIQRRTPVGPADARRLHRRPRRARRAAHERSVRGIAGDRDEGQEEVASRGQ